jgi:hypothetical protein
VQCTKSQFFAALQHSGKFFDKGGGNRQHGGYHKHFGNADADKVHEINLMRQIKENPPAYRTGVDCAPSGPPNK